MKKQEIKQSEARILLYLSVVNNTRKYVRAMSTTLETDYSYIMRVLQDMIAKGWLKKHKYKQKMFYDLTSTAPVEEAKIAFSMGYLQSELQQYAEPIVEVTEVPIEGWPKKNSDSEEDKYPTAEEVRANEDRAALEDSFYEE